MHSKLEQLLIIEKQNEEDKDEMLKFYGSDFEKKMSSSPNSIYFMPPTVYP